ncbi:hypothetical protein QU667_04255 [Selenomonas dianae]|uniref:hypothetical protein n=1 Tax=Selenomonas dianae TaxID=135079 RepID=UPI00272D519F|nr:hypothetical protein [Selenomonas dianae]WLD83186.1 hypothetical protein QU667_04255 [Selenomonas dianae]
MDNDFWELGTQTLHDDVLFVCCVKEETEMYVCFPKSFLSIRWRRGGRIDEAEITDLLNPQKVTGWFVRLICENCNELTPSISLLIFPYFEWMHICEFDVREAFVFFAMPNEV